ncbi:MAG: spore coat protein [Clostridium sp.]|uniref:spore coat protein n=1 Tax=Clostridium sp. TaxID=1506 RepID=UPI003D6D6544
MDITLSQKERMLLEDQKNHEQICIEKYMNYGSQAKDTQLKQICKANEQMERSHLDSINQLLSGSIPQMNQQQNQNSTQDVNSIQSVGTSLSDKDMCTDLLMTEKFVSGAYDTTIFEFRDTGVRDVLNHIQKEEQKHGEAIFKYMESKGMYSVQ